MVETQLWNGGDIFSSLAGEEEGRGGPGGDGDDSIFTRRRIAKPWYPAGAAAAAAAAAAGAGAAAGADAGAGAGAGAAGTSTKNHNNNKEEDNNSLGGGAATSAAMAPPPYVSMIMCGDFNAPPTSASYALLQSSAEKAMQEMHILRKLFADGVRYKGERDLIAKTSMEVGWLFGWLGG